MKAALNRSRKPFVLVSCLLGFLLATAVSSAVAQESMIIGVVTDQSKGVLPGVTVTATSPSLQMPSVAVVTDGKGE